MRIDVVTLFPELVQQCIGFGVIGRAVERRQLEVQAWNPRDHAEGGYRRVDDTVCGGGPGMVMLIEPLPMEEAETPMRVAPAMFPPSLSMVIEPLPVLVA